MTKLQEKILAADKLKGEQRAVFEKHADVSAIPADQLAEIKSRNEQIAALDAEIKQLEEVEAMRSTAITYSHSGAPTSAKADNTIPTPAIEFARVSKVKNFKGTVGGKSADERAYRFGKWFKGAIVGDPQSAQSPTIFIGPISTWT